MRNNTIVTMGDMNGLRGIFLLICSMRKNGMDEPVIAGVRGFTPEAETVLTQLGDVRLFPLNGTMRPLVCYKPLVMLQAKTEYITWVDGDGCFTGNCSERLIPLDKDEIHIRIRSPRENRRAFRGRLFGESGEVIPRRILNAWRRDVCGVSAPRLARSCSARCFSLHRSARPFLEQWHRQMERLLPPEDTEAAEHFRKYYHQPDESVLNSLLAFSPFAPRISEEYRLDKAPAEMFIHLAGVPNLRGYRFCGTFCRFNAPAAVFAYARRRGLLLPGGQQPSSPKPGSRALRALLRAPAAIGRGIRGGVKRILKKR